MVMNKKKILKQIKHDCLEFEILTTSDICIEIDAIPTQLRRFFIFFSPQKKKTKC